MLKKNCCRDVGSNYQPGTGCISSVSPQSCTKNKSPTSVVKTGAMPIWPSIKKAGEYKQEVLHVEYYADSNG